MSGDWTPAGGPQTGKGVAVGALASAATTSIAVTFPVAYANAPVVKVMPFSSRLTPGMAALSTTGFTVSLSNWSPASAGATTFDWEASPA